MFSFFKRKVRVQDAAFEQLASMLTEEEGNPTYRRELLDPAALDFSLDSLKHVDAYLDAVRKDDLQGEALLRVVLRCGAYVGEVVRRCGGIEFHWVDYEQAAKESSMVKEAGKYLGTMGVLRADPDRMCFPLGKVCKFIEGGPDDSVYFFAKVLIEGLPQIEALDKPE